MSHTPGPWKVQTYNRNPIVSGYCPVEVVMANGKKLRIANDASGDANARLISAAPDLLKMCREALAAWTGDGPPLVLDELRAAISKATGSQMDAGDAR